MSATSAESFPRESSRAWRGLLWGGLLAGVLDITAACVSNYAQRGTSPVVVLQSVAGGLLGRDAYQRGAGSAALGLALHFLIAFGAAFVFYAASRKLKFLVRHAFVAGLLYGVAVYFFMALVVLPLSASTYRPSFEPFPLTLNLLIHIFCVGLPIALAVRRYSESE